jgi:FkbM family methyltransferase
VLINGRWTLQLPEHRAARPQWLIENGGWELERLDAMKVAITPGMTVFDVGAEEGDFPALFASWGANVVLFEPNPLVWPNIKLIWDANHLGAPTGWFVGFASSSTVLHPVEEEKIFSKPDQDGWPACAFGPVIGDHGFRNVSERFHDTPQTTIDDYVSRTGIRPDLLTLDVEGAELEVLRGAANTLRNRQIPVFVSVHPEFMVDMYGHSDDQLHSFMEGLGYYGTHLATDHEQHWLFT